LQLQWIIDIIKKTQASGYLISTVLLLVS